jgi:hypothetical protein
MPEMTPDQMQARIAELDSQLSMVCRLTGVPREMIEPPTEEEIHEMLHGPKAPPGEFERVIREFARSAGIEA